MQLCAIYDNDNGVFMILVHDVVIFCNHFLCNVVVIFCAQNVVQFVVQIVVQCCV